MARTRVSYPRSIVRRKRTFVWDILGVLSEQLSSIIQSITNQLETTYRFPNRFRPLLAATPSYQQFTLHPPAVGCKKRRHDCKVLISYLASSAVLGAAAAALRQASLRALADADRDVLAGCFALPSNLAAAGV